MWDTHFEGGRDHRRELCSATQIPYLEGDYWHGEAENMLTNLAEGGSKVRPVVVCCSATAALFLFLCFCSKVRSSSGWLLVSGCDSSPGGGLLARRGGEHAD